MEYFERHVLRNAEAYRIAEDHLTVEDQNDDAVALHDASENALAAGMNAAVASYHMADNIWEQHKGGAPTYGKSSLADYRAYLDANFCLYSATQNIWPELAVLGALADAHKHYQLRSSARPISSSHDTLVCQRGFGLGPYDEGKFGGVAEVWIVTKTGIRALGMVLFNVNRMWAAEIAKHGL
jgi:hypothetical protein